MVKWSVKDVERVTGKKIVIEKNNKIPTLFDMVEEEQNVSL